MSDAQACLPPWLGAGDRAWGFALNLYTLRSKRNWGIGDFSDLRAFVRIAAGFGASYVGLNPLHALHPLDPAAASPYAPSSRFFLNPLYIDVAAVPEYRRISGRHTARERLEHKSALAELRATPHVMYERVAAQKQRFFRELFEAFQRRDDERRARFEAFVAAGGARLERFARYEALDEFFAAHEAGLCGWLNWPSD
ncbi:MAG TPA: 4-alpha-glucanotransferase, partial [Candidatus Baltobacteraceae bacterium]|nr:4-alpha-glucanotransferase [Candidatus Baltobacteraceae bacterium]